MKALLYDKDGSREFLGIREIEKPAPKKNEVLWQFTPYPSTIGIGGSFRTRVSSA